MRAGPEKIVQVPREEVASVRKPLYPEVGVVTRDVLCSGRFAAGHFQVQEQVVRG